MVDRASTGFFGLSDLHRVHQLGDLGKRLLRVIRHRLPFADVFAPADSRSAGVVASILAVFGGHFYSLGAARVPRHLLLLSRRLLQGGLAGSALLHSRRAAQNLLGRALIPADPAK